MKRVNLKIVKDLVGCVRNWKENIEEHGYDMSEYSAHIRYKDGTVNSWYGSNNEKISLNARNIKYIVLFDSDDSYDSEGKSWSKDFVKDNDYADTTSVDKWNEYVNNNLYGVTN